LREQYSFKQKVTIKIDRSEQYKEATERGAEFTDVNEYRSDGADEVMRSL